MLTYDLKVGYACNNRCKHCVIDDSKDKLINEKKSINLTTNECLQQIDFAISKGAKNIVLTGGEVSIRKDFLMLIKKCINNNLNVTIQTNGRNLSKMDFVTAIKNIKNIKFIIALHGSNSKTHDNITQINGSFIETCEGITTMCNLGKNVILKVVISKINAKELPQIVELASSLGAKFICFAFPHGQGAARKNFDEVMPKYSYLKPIFNKLIKNSKKYKINIEFEAVPYCIIPSNMHLVGELKYLSEDIICAQVKEDVFNWNNIRKSIKKKGANCINCDMNDFCEGVWFEYIDKNGSDEFKPIIIPKSYRSSIVSTLSSMSCKINKI